MVEDDLKSTQIWVPARETAVSLLNSYEAQMNTIQSVIHLPTVRQKLSNFYTALHHQQPVEVGFVALLLAICASIGFWDRHLDVSSTSFVMMSKASTFLSKQAIYATEHTRLSAQISIEAVQASILLTFHICHLEGFTSRTRLLHNSALTMARELGLHMLDAPRSAARPKSETGIIEMEVGRRIWWHLASSDW